MPPTNGNIALLNAYEKTQFIRTVELELANRYHPTSDPSQSPMKCPMHLSVGQEHIATGVKIALEEKGIESHAYSTHRAHAHYLAWGGDLRRMIAELMGKETGCANGWGGSMHLVDESVGFMGTSAIVGSSLSYAVGDALAAKLDGSDRLTVAFVGDAVPETGQFWESINFALVHKLNILIVIEDNNLATATPLQDRQYAPLIWSLENVLPMKEASSYLDITYMVDDLTHLKNDTPRILVAKADRYAEHVGPNIDFEPLAEPGDPLYDLREAAIKAGVSVDDLNNAQTLGYRRFEKAWAQAEADLFPTAVWA